MVKKAERTRKSGTYVIASGDSALDRFGTSNRKNCKVIMGLGEKMTWEELQAVKNHQHYDSYYEAN